VLHLVVVPRQNAGQALREKRPHLAQGRPHRLIDLNKSRRIAFQSGVICGSRSSGAAVRLSNIKSAWLTECDFSVVLLEVQISDAKKARTVRGLGFALGRAEVSGRLADRNLQRTDAVDTAFDLVARVERGDASRPFPS